jgi:ubiquinone/menaquinone biosynthesis C-methylase UbiE
MQRRPEPELMDQVEEAVAYAAADFASVNRAFVDRLMELVGSNDRPIQLLDLGCGPGDIPIDIPSVGQTGPSPPSTARPRCS